MSTVIILVCQGQTEWDQIERFQGNVDVPLNATGMGQAKKTAKYIHKRWKPAAIFTSPSRRTMQTAEQIAKTCGIVVHWTDGLMDMDYGKWQGLTPEDARKQRSEQITNWYEHPEIAQIPGGESLEHVRSRAVSALNEICWLHENKEIILVSHSLVNRLILLNVLGLENDHFWNIRQEPCSINIIEKVEEKYIVHSINCTSHL
jgi:phosphoserine phosphatase